MAMSGASGNELKAAGEPEIYSSALAHVRHLLRSSGLSLAMFGIFGICMVLLSFVGQRHYNQEQQAHGEPSASWGHYVTSDAFLETTMENWESEFLQMFGYVVLTVFLYQKGSSESKDPDLPDDSDAHRITVPVDAPWPVKRGGAILWLYEHSLSLALFALFAFSFVLHVVGGAGAYNEEQMAHGEPTVSIPGYLLTSQMWFESLQNWQSEFLAVGAMVVLTIFLREKGSPESKKVGASMRETGSG
jgi:hypothetical protein